MNWHRRLHRRSLPVLLQSEAAECGLACIAMIACYWRKPIDLLSLRQRFSVSLKGLTLKTLMSIAQRLGFQSRPLSVELQHLSRLKSPCILHWDMNHFVVLKHVTTKHLVIHDPVCGARRISWARASEHYTGIVLELLPGELFKPSNERSKISLWSMLGKVDGLYSGIVKLLMMGLVLQVITLATPFYVQWVIDDVLASGDRQLMTILGASFLLLVLLQTSLAFLRSWMTTTLSTYLNYQWLGNAFAHLLRLPIPWFEKRHLGDITSRFNALQTIQKTITTQLIESVIDGLLVITTLVFMFFYSLQLTGVCLLTVSLYAMLRCHIFNIQREAHAVHISHTAKQHTLFIESARGIQSIRLFGSEEQRRQTWTNELVDQLNAELRVSRLSLSSQSASAWLFNSERVIVIWLAALAVMNNHMSVGMLFAFLSYREQFSQRIAALIDKLFELKMLKLHGERVSDILLTAPEEETHTLGLKTESLPATLELRHVSFRFADEESDVISDVNLKVSVGECLAITGGSGSGKTTLLKLMLGLLKPSAGEVLVGGIPIEALGMSNYRKMVATVMQDDQLFTGSLSDNICFFDTKPDHSAIVKCARQAAIHEEIINMPMKYRTLVGDIGSGLSGGQKQRILLARAFYRSPKMLVLDEATSHLDVENEKLVNLAIADSTMTRVLVAHRPETIAMAERVVILSQGKIIQDTKTAE